MKIRTLLITSVVTFSILLLIISGLVFVTNQQIGKLVEQEEIANSIALKVGDLGYLSNDYILFHESQQAERWNTKFASISDDVASLSVDKPDQQAIVSNLKTNLRNTKFVFDDIVSNPAQTGGVAETGFVQLSWSRIAVQNQGMVFDAGRLRNLFHIESERLMQVRNQLIFLLMSVFIAFLLTSYLIFYRRALKSISAISKGTKIIGSGNLNHKIETGADDEIGELSRAINLMTADLRKVTASKTDLEREVSEHMRAEENLVRNNEDLNALNEELTATQEELQQNVNELSRREAELHSTALFPTENPSPTMRVNDRGILLFANPASTHVLGCWKTDVRKKVPDHIIRSAHDSLAQEIMQETEEICEPRVYSIRFAPIPDQKYINLYFSDITERKEAEMALREAHRRTAAILGGVADTFYSLDTQWRFVTVNPAAEKAPFGRPATELLGKVIWDLYPSLIGTRIHQHYLDAAEKHTLEHYEAQSPLNGRWYEVFLQGREGGVDVYMRDITDRKKAEEALRKSEEEYRHLVKYAPAAIYEIASDGLRFRRVNDAMCHILGYTPAELMEMNPFDILDEESKLRFNERIKKRLAGYDIDESVVYRIFGRGGREIWVTLNIKLNHEDGGTLVVAHDVTERKRAEDALRQTEERFRLALKNAPLSVAVQDCNLVYQWAFNQRTRQHEEIIGKTDADLFTPEDQAWIGDLKRTALESGDPIRVEKWLTSNGRRMYLDLYLEPLLDDKGQITGIGIATIDLTEQKLIEDTLRYSEENLLQAQELLEAVTKGADVIIAVQDTHFRYIFFNQPYKEEIKRLTGKNLSIGSSMIEVFAEVPEEQKMSLNEWSKVLNGENVNQTIAFGIPGSKNRRIYHVLHVPIRDAQGTIIAAGEVAYDITRQAQVEEALRETKEYLDNLITYANAPIIVWDPQFHITLFNRAFEHLTGRKAKEVLGKHLDILFPENYLDPAMDLIRKTVQGERWDSVEIPILDKKGAIRTVLWNSASIFGPDGHTIISTIAQGQDITDRKMMESESRLRAKGYAEMNIVLEEEIRQRKISDTTLKNTLSLLNASLESTADGILVVDQRGKITSFNKNFMNMWNLPEDLLDSGKHRAVINHVLPQLKNPEGYIANIQELENHPGRESFDMIEFNDGKIFERYSKPQKLGNTVVGRVWSFRDITDRKRAEENLVASLGEKEVLLREIHHRVKNNLQLISGLIDMTRMRTVDESTNSVLTDLMLKIQTMAQIHTRLYESKQFGKISLTGQIRDQVTALSNIYSHKGHGIICDIAADEIFLPVDQAIPCALVVNEILSNAYKHAFKGRKHGTIEISAAEEDGQIQIVVRDDGIGIPSDFDISRANSLGLKLVRTLVQYQLKGSLMFKSQNGTEFSMEFPVITAGT